MGSSILFSYNHLAKYPDDAWIELYCSNVVGGIMVTWALGICNMLTVTLTVLQLREVLHPDILAKFIRPQEPHLELLSSLMHESGYTHVRRLAVSLTVYLSVLVVLMHIPVLLLQEARSGIPHELWQVRYWYVVPQIQLPLETSISLGIFLSLLEKKKNVIGKLLHVWFKHASNYLGLTRYCMPLNFEVLTWIGPTLTTTVTKDANVHCGHCWCVILIVGIARASNGVVKGMVRASGGRAPSVPSGDKAHLRDLASLLLRQPPGQSSPSLCVWRCHCLFCTAEWSFDPSPYHSGCVMTSWPNSWACVRSCPTGPRAGVASADGFARSVILVTAVPSSVDAFAHLSTTW